MAFACTPICPPPAAAVIGANITFTVTGLSYPSLTSSNINIPAPATSGFASGDLAVEQEDLVTANSTFSMLDLSSTVSNSAPLNIFPVPATGTNGLRQSSSGSAGRLADSDDGTLVCFSAAVCSDSTVSDITTLNERGAGTFNAQGNYVLQTTYLGDGQDTDQARSAITLDDTNFFMGDKGGVFLNGQDTNSGYIVYTTGNSANVRSLKSFGGTIYVMQQEGGTDPSSTVLSVLPLPGSASAGTLFPLEGFLPDGSVLDFYMLKSGHNGTNYDVAYYIDGTNNTSGAIFKYYFTGGIERNHPGQQEWAPAGMSFRRPWRYPANSNPVEYRQWW